MKATGVFMVLFPFMALVSHAQRHDQASVFNEYHTLREVFVGTANVLYFPESHAIEAEGNATWISKFLTQRVYPKFAGKKVPDWIARKFRKEEEALLEVLREHNVTIHRPEDVIPLPDEPSGLGQMYARDPIITVGNTMLDSQLQIPMRRKENRGFENLLDKLAANGVSVETLRQEDAYLEGGM